MKIYGITVIINKLMKRPDNFSDEEYLESVVLAADLLRKEGEGVAHVVVTEFEQEDTPNLFSYKGWETIH